MKKFLRRLLPVFVAAKYARALLLPLGLLLTLSPVARAQTTATASVLHRFSGKDGKNPFALIPSGSGDFYGITEGGGDNNNGTIFSITPGGQVTTLYSFAATEGARPISLVRAADGTLYGATNQGGTGQQGTVFKLAADGTFSTLHSFTALDARGVNADGAEPAGLLVGSDGQLYGVTTSGGAHSAGTVYTITRAGMLTTLASFTPPAPLQRPSLGTSPVATLTQGKDGNFYGTTNFGGANNGGTVFSVTPSGAFTVLHNFSGADAAPAESDGVAPETALIQGGNGNFYGTTVGGGLNGSGTVFSISPGGAFTSLHSFGAFNLGTQVNADGILPVVLIQGGDGNFYGVTQVGGSTGNGTIFAITPAGALTVVYVFDVAKDGGFSLDSLVQAPGSYFLGTTLDGGSSGFLGDGTVEVFSLPSPTLPVASLSTSTPTVQIDGGTGTVTVSLSSAASSKVLVHYAIKGSATDGTDYTLLSGTAKIKPGKTSKTVAITPKGTLGGAAKKSIKLTLIPDAGYTVGAQKSVKVKLVQP